MWKPNWREPFSSSHCCEFSWDNDPKSLQSILHCKMERKLPSQTSNTMEAYYILFSFWSIITSNAYNSFSDLGGKCTQSCTLVFPQTKSSRMHWLRWSKLTFVMQSTPQYSPTAFYHFNLTLKSFQSKGHLHQKKKKKWHYHNSGENP